MKVTPVATPHAMSSGTGTPDSRSRAIAAFEAANGTNATPEPTPMPIPKPQEHPVADPNNVSVEELSAITSQERPALTSQETPTEDRPQERPETEKLQRDPALSKQFAQLARQERIARQKIQQQQQALKAREAELAAKEAAITSKEQQYSQGYISKDQLQKDTLRILADAGVSYEDLTQQILNSSQSNPVIDSHIARLETKIAQLEKAAEDSKKSYADQQVKARQDAVKQIRVDAFNLVKNDPNYETIRDTKSIDDVVDLIVQTYDKDGVLLSVEEAAQEVENYLVDEALKLTRIGKIKQRIEQGAQSQQKTQAPNQQPQPKMKTLTNAASSSRKLSAKERAVLAFRGELKT